MRNSVTFVKKSTFLMKNKPLRWRNRCFSIAEVLFCFLLTAEHKKMLNKNSGMVE